MEESDSLLERFIDDERSRRVDGWTVALAGLVSGVAFLAVIWIGHRLAPAATVWNAPLRIAAMLVRGDPLTTADTAPPPLFVGAVAVHAVLSLFYALLIGLATRRVPVPYDLVAGALLGLFFYAVDYHAMIPLFPAFATDRGPVTVAAHVAFGIAAVGVFAWRGAREARRSRSPRTSSAQGLSVFPFLAFVSAGWSCVAST